MIIALGGFARAGKDTVAEHLRERRGFEIVRFNTAIREAAMRINPMVRAPKQPLLNRLLRAPKYVPYADLVNRIGYEQAKDASPDVRPILQRIGTDMGRGMLGKDIWVNFTRTVIADLDRQGRDIVLSDTRFPNELACGVTLGQHSIWLDRPGIVAGDHESDHAIQSGDFDVVLTNSGSVAAMLHAVDGMVLDWADTQNRGRR